jgi:hypothetical protein
MPNNAQDNELKELAEFLLKYYPGEIAEETPVKIAIRLLSPTQPGVNDNSNTRVPNWAVDTLAKKELRRLAQYMMDNLPTRLGKGTVVDSVVECLEKAY